VHGPKSAHGLAALAWPNGQITRRAHALGGAGARHGAVTTPGAGVVVRRPPVLQWPDQRSVFTVSMRAAVWWRRTWFEEAVAHHVAGKQRGGRGDGGGGV
jgi:hypothetical protein